MARQIKAVARVGGVIGKLRRMNQRNRTAVGRLAESGVRLRRVEIVNVVEAGQAKPLLAACHSDTFVDQDLEPDPPQLADQAFAQLAGRGEFEQLLGELALHHLDLVLAGQAAPRNPNLLRWHGRPWLIDHGAALYFHHD